MSGQQLRGPSRRAFVSSTTAILSTAILSSSSSQILPLLPAHAIGPVKIELTNPKYQAIICPKDRPIPGEKAMKGMRGLCVTVQATLAERPDKELSRVGVYGFVTDEESGESVRTHVL